MSQEPDDDAWKKRIERAAEAIRAWEDRVGNPDEVHPGSSLARDDTALPKYPPSICAWYSISTAVDHLGLLTDLLEAPGGRVLRPHAPFTVTRTALLAASQAVWVLGGTRAERLRRTRLIAADERYNHARYLRDYAADDFVQTAVDPAFLAEIQQLLGRLDAEKTEFLEPLREVGDKSNYVSTVMMREAAQHLRAQGRSNEWLGMALGHEWRMASAAAHARYWPLHVRPSQSEPLPDGGEIRRMTTSLAEFGQTYGAATMMLSEAWRLWDLRRIPHR